MRLPSSRFFSVALLGWVVATGQTVLLREAMAASQGNEMAIALALGQWLVLTAGGSALAGLCAPQRARRLLQASALLLGPALGGALMMARGLPRIFGILPGTLLTLDQQVLGLALVLAPVCLLGGASFTWATRLPGLAPASAYLSEALGWLAGGVTATWLVSTWQPFVVFALLTLGAAFAAKILSGPRWALLAVLVALVLTLGHSGLAVLEQVSLGWRWPGETLVKSLYTRYGHAVVLARGGPRTLFLDGHLAMVLPEPQSSQELVHLALAQVHEPRRVFVWSGLGGLLPEILKHPVQDVVMAEPDAALAELETQVADPATRAALLDGRVRVEIGDVRSLMRRSVLGWDAILLSAAEPSTLLAARVLTQESFAEMARALRPGGVLAFALSGAENYYPAELLMRNGAVWKALAASFAYVVATPLSTNYFLASQSPVQTDAATLARRLERRNVTGAFVDDASLDALMPGERMQGMNTRYQATPVSAASDRQPRAFRYSLAIAGRADAGYIARLWPKVMGVAWWPFASLGVLVLLALGLLGRRIHSSVLVAVFAIGFASMGSTVLILMVAQSAVGALHHFLGALLAAHMTGLALSCGTPWPRPRLSIAWGLGLLVSALIPLLARAAVHVSASMVMTLLLLVSLLAGVAVGCAFRSALDRGVGPAAAYVADLLGAALAAPATALIVLPGLGLDGSAGVFAFLVFSAAMATKTASNARLPM